MTENEKLKIRLEMWKREHRLLQMYFGEACRDIARLTGYDTQVVTHNIMERTEDDAIRLRLRPIPIDKDLTCNEQTQGLLEFISDLVFRSKDKKLAFKNELKDIDKRQVKKFFKEYGYKITFKKNDVFIDEVAK